MIKVGFVDDEANSYFDYATRLKRFDVEAIFSSECTDKEDIIDWILEEKLETLLVDYKLSLKYDFTGTDLVYFLNSKIPDFVCIILTNHPNDSQSENLVAKNMILDKKLLNEELTSFKQMLVQAADVFKKRTIMRLDEYNKYLDKKKRGTLSSNEEESFLWLFKLLRAYGEIDDLPTELLKTSTESQMDILLSKLDKLIGTK